MDLNVPKIVQPKAQVQFLGSTTGSLASIGRSQVGKEVYHKSERPVKRKPRNGGLWFRWDNNQKIPVPEKKFDKKIIKVVGECEKWNFLADWQRHSAQQTSVPKGFKKRVIHKRHADKIQAETKKKLKPRRSKRVWSSSHAQKMKILQQPHGFNPICWRKQHTPRKGHEILLGQKPHVKNRRGKSGTLEAEGYAKLRSAGSRFYCPLPSNNKYVKQRQERIRLEGLPHMSRTSSSIGIGRGDLPSYGVKDNFEKSLYYVKPKPKAERKLNAKAARYKPTPDWWQ